MKESCKDIDTPLFPEEEEGKKDEVSASAISEREAADMERLVGLENKLSEINRKNSAHTFSIVLLCCILGTLFLMTVIEYFVAAENEYIKELFEFFKYVATTLIGFLFANSKEK